MAETTEEYRNRINQLKTDIENEPYIKQMRGDIAEGISKTGIRQATVEEQFQSVLDETTGKDVISAPEIIAARDGATTLGERLDSEKVESLAKANEFETEIAKKADKTQVDVLGSEIYVARGGTQTLGERLDSDKDEVSAQLAQTVYKNEANVIAPDMLTTEARAMLTGGKVAVVGTKSVGLQQLSTELQNDVGEWVDEELQLTKNTHYRIENGIAVPNTSTTNYQSFILNTTEGLRRKVYLRTNSALQTGIIYANDQLQVIGTELKGTGVTVEYKNHETTTPSGATKLILCTFSSEPAWKDYISSSRFNYTPIATVQYVRKTIEESGLESKKGETFSVLGDSTSAYIGHIPSGNVPYYRGDNAGVSDVSQMWWSVLAEKTGMTPLVVNAWSGSKVSNIDLDGNGFVPASDTSRSQNLDDGVSMPNNIFIKMGINDFSKNGAAIGSWKGGTTLPTTNDNFSNAYALMLSRIRAKYPHSKIFCLSMGVFVRTNKDKDGVEYNIEGKTVHDYNEVIRTMCDLFGATYVDTQNIGVTRQNMYPTYAIDYETIPTHMNSLGNELLGEHVSKEIL